MIKHILAVCLLLAGTAGAQTLTDNQVKVDNGILQGSLESSAVHIFKGIPFAQPPVWDLRWRPPQPAKDWPGVRPATRFGPRAVQGSPASDTTIRTDQMGEDCLYLNVWTPAKTAEEHLPVLVWFYGGGFQGGDGSEVRYDGESIAQRGIVYVTVNYRLGIFGFMAHPELTQESPHHSSGNYGLLDQHAALKWVQTNIAAFGGDPKKVTIAGQSAGSLSVCAQMASPLSKDLISGAIGESGSVMGTLTPVPLQEAEKVGQQFALKAGFKSLAELRAAPAEQLYLAASKPRTRFPLTVDGYFFPADPAEIFKQGKQARIPLLVGWNSREGAYESVLKDSPTVENFEKAVKQLYPDNWQAVLKAYTPARTDREAIIRSATDLASDRFIGFSTWKWADIHCLTAKQPVYRYYYTWERAPLRKDLEKTGGTPPSPRTRYARHSAEIEYAWGNLDKTSAWAWTEEDHKLSQAMEAYFANFIKTGNPNGKGLPNWPAIKPGEPSPFMRLDATPGAETEEHRDRYLLLDRIRSQ